MKKSKPEQLSDAVRSFFFFLCIACTLAGVGYLLQGNAGRTLSLSIGGLVFYMMSHIEYRDLDR